MATTRTHIPRLIFAALRGGAGKTAASVGVARAWRNHGSAVATFKKGPDYIDAAWLTRAVGAPCYNLDTFLMGEAHCMESFLERSRGADVAVIEGARGLFDGMDAQGTHSTAALAGLLQAPVVLVLDCTKITRTAAALVLGCLHFDPGVRIAGVILNQVARSRHEDILRESIESRCGVPVLGCVPRIKNFPFKERHLGLIPPQEHASVDVAVAELANNVADHVDLGALLRIARSAPPLAVPEQTAAPQLSMQGARPRVGVVRDSAFQFYYPENLESLQRLGAEIVPVSALADATLPEIDALYMGGGFPETHAAPLAANESFRASLLAAIRRGLPVYAECGGAMYLGKSLVVDGAAYPMVGALPIVYGIQERPRGHGYTVARVARPNPFFNTGATLRGHEFHYSYVLESGGELDYAFDLERGYGFDGRHDGVCRGNVLAAYSHIHAAGEQGWAAGLMLKAASFAAHNANSVESYETKRYIKLFETTTFNNRQGRT